MKLGRQNLFRCPIHGCKISPTAKRPKQLTQMCIRDRTGEDQEKTFSTVMKHITASDLPRTGYIVTLLLWAIRQGNKLERINEAALIMNMVDFLLGKANFQPVSYTHLDVYKRQLQDGRRRSWIRMRSSSVWRALRGVIWGQMAPAMKLGPMLSATG